MSSPLLCFRLSWSHSPLNIYLLSHRWYFTLSYQTTLMSYLTFPSLPFGKSITSPLLSFFAFPDVQQIPRSRPVSRSLAYIHLLHGRRSAFSFLVSVAGTATDDGRRIGWDFRLSLYLFLLDMMLFFHVLSTLPFMCYLLFISGSPSFLVHMVVHDT